MPHLSILPPAFGAKCYRAITGPSSSDRLLAESQSRPRSRSPYSLALPSLPLRPYFTRPRPIEARKWRGLQPILLLRHLVLGASLCFAPLLLISTTNIAEYHIKMFSNRFNSWNCIQISLPSLKVIAIGSCLLSDSWVE